jgi:UDP-N-acetylmuramoyl-tripeptide--D-alanyl-D-alanine ligase
LSKNIARVVARRLGVPDQAVESALEAAGATKGRLNRLQARDLTVIDDSYNANPLSMRLGLDTLAEAAPAGCRRVAILGTMGELGAESERYHREIGQHARRCADLVIGVGDMGRRYAPDRWFEDSESCARAIGGLVSPGDWLLVKGSASVAMSRVVDRLMRDAGGRTSG